MLQHLLVGLIFVVCVYWIVRHVVRYLSHVRKGKVQCGTCTETSCPLHGTQMRACTDGKHKKKGSVIKNCKKKDDINLSIQK